MARDDNDLLRDGELPPDPAAGGVEITAVSPRRWEPPLPLVPDRKLPAFPVHVFPTSLSRFVEGLATETRTPPDIAGGAVLGILSAACAGKARVRVAGEHYEPLNLFVMVVAEPGCGKSPVIGSAIKPLERWERQETEKAKPIIKDAEIRKRVLEQRRDRLQEEAARTGGDNALQGLRRVEEDLDEIEVPPQPRLLADDSTPEKLAGLLAEQKGRIAIVSGEGTILRNLAGQYHRDGRSAAGVALKAWGGETLLVDRIGRPRDHVIAPALTLVLAVQETILDDLMGNKDLTHQGFLARFLFILPRDIVGFRPGEVPAMTASTREAYQDIITNILDWPFSGTDPDSTCPPANLHLDRGALESLRRFEAKVEVELRSGGRLGSRLLRGWGNKLVGTTARVAGLLHAAEYDGLRDAISAPISRPTMDRAVSLSEYFIEHAQAAFDSAGIDPVTDNAILVRRWILRNGKEIFKRSECAAAVRFRSQRQGDTLAMALQRLEEANCIVQEPAPQRCSTGRPPGPVYRVNPALFSGEPSR